MQYEYAYPTRRLRVRHALEMVRTTRRWINAKTVCWSGMSRLIADHRLDTDTAYLRAVLKDRNGRRVEIWDR